MSEESQEISSFVAPTLDELDHLLDGYVFESFIAQGGMGAVYLARQESLDRDVAVKVLPRELSKDEKFTQSFRFEAKLMAKLNHPNLIGIYDFGNMDGMLYIIMEFVKGNSLHHSANGKAISQEVAVSIISAICSGLSHAHQAGILHRDIKPANILLSQDASPKIGDFGLARPNEMTESGVIYGTPGYSAPEVIDAPDKVDNRTDIYSVGVMFYELLTGHLPADDYVSVTNYIEADVRFDEIIKKAIHPNIDMRYSCVQDFADEVTKVIENPAKVNKLLVAEAKNKGIGTKQAMPSAPSPMISRPYTNAPSSKIGRKIVIIILLIAAIFIVLKMKNNKAIEISSNSSKNTIPNKKNPEPIKLSPIEQLAEVKELLSYGERPMAMMPKTIFMRDDDSRIMMYIDKKMTWDEADTWTRQHGGYLAVCKSQSDITAFMNQIPEDTDSVWLGAGCSGDKGWSWVDDTPWTDTLDLEADYDRTFAKLSRLGSVAKTNSDNKLNFFIEWRADGTNPADLEYRLLRTRNTLTEINPKYPPGTITAGSRNYSIIKSLVTFEEASELAIASGGHLIAITNENEKFEVEGMVAKYCKPGATLWTAAEKKNSVWGWQTGEKWVDLTWVASHPQNADHALILAAEKLLIKDASPLISADGFIIEWSEDKSKVKKTSLNNNDAHLNSQLKALKNKAISLVAKQLATTEEKHAFNVKKLSSNLEKHLLALTRNQRTVAAETLDPIVALVKNQSRVSKSLAGQGPSAKSIEYINYALEKQTKIDLYHTSEMHKLRKSYIKRLRMLEQTMKESGQINVVKSINDEAKNIGNTAADFENYFSQ